MPSKNGLSTRIVAWVAANPGRLSADLGEALGFEHRSGLLTYMVQSGQLFAAGPRSWHRFYPTQEQADQNHQRLCEEADQRRRDVRIEHWRQQNLRRKAARAALGKRKPAAEKATLQPGARITVIPAPPPRFAPSPGFERTISADWMLRRQGVDIREYLSRA